MLKCTVNIRKVLSKPLAGHSKSPWKIENPSFEVLFSPNWASHLFLTFCRTIELNYSDENVDDFFSNINVDPVLRSILSADSPVWLTVTESHSQQNSPLTQMKQGLNLAQTLGDAAKDGFNVIYLPINSKAWYEPTISYYVTLLHKRIIGRTVFDTKMFNGNRFDSHFYAHCTKNMSGSFSVMGVNAGDSKLDILAKLPFKSGTQYMEFILTVSVNGRVQLNGREIVEPAVLGPVPKSKLPGKATYLNMPAYSIAFWVFTEADVDECYDEETPLYEVTGNRLKTSSERLLQDLIVEAVSRTDEKDRNDKKNVIQRESDQELVKRSRRSIDSLPFNQELETTNEIKIKEKSKKVTKAIQLPRGHRRSHNDLYAKRSKRDINTLKNLFDKFDFKKSIFDFKLPPPLKLRSPLLIPPIVHDIHQNPSEAEKRLFTPRDNPSLPERDVHLEVAVDASVNTERFNNGNVNGNGPQMDYGNIASNNAVPMQYSVNPGNSIPSSALLGELSEIEMPQQRNMNVEPIVKAPPKQENIQFVMKALPPTILMNQENMEKARANLRNNLWPMANGQPLVKLPAFLQPISQLPRVEVEQTFETRRRRRSIDAAAMNEAIENRVQGITKAESSTVADDTNKATILAQLLSMAEDIEKSERERSKQMPSSGGHGELLTKLKGKIEKLSNGASLPSTELFRQNEVRRKCRIIAKSVEQQCLQTESKPIYRRSARESVNSPIRRLMTSIRARIQNRHKRAIVDDDDDDDFETNMITKYAFEYKKPTKSDQLPYKVSTKYEPEDDKLSPLPDNEEPNNEEPHTQRIFLSLEKTITSIIDFIMSRISKLSARTMKMIN